MRDFVGYNRFQPSVIECNKTQCKNQFILYLIPLILFVANCDGKECDLVEKQNCFNELEGFSEYKYLSRYTLNANEYDRNMYCK